MISIWGILGNSTNYLSMLNMLIRELRISGPELADVMLFGSDSIPSLIQFFETDPFKSQGYHHKFLQPEISISLFNFFSILLHLVFTIL